MNNLLNKIKAIIAFKEKDPFPPSYSLTERLYFIIIWVPLCGALLYLLDQFCFNGFVNKSVCGTYIAFTILLIMFLFDRILRHKMIRHDERREDPSEVQALFVEAETVAPRLEKPETRPEDYEQKVKNLNEEIKRLKNLGERGWTEYQVLSLNQMVVDFLKIEELKTRAKSSLEDLQEYSDDRYDEKHYEDWKERVEEATKKIEDIEKAEIENLLKIDTSAEPLRAELNILLEHVADYDRYWAECVLTSKIDPL